MFRSYLQPKSFLHLYFWFHVFSIEFLEPVIFSLNSSDVFICKKASLTSFIESQRHTSKLFKIIVDVSSWEIFVCNEVSFAVVITCFSKVFLGSLSCLINSRVFPHPVNWSWMNYLQKLFKFISEWSCLVWSLLPVSSVYEVSLVFSLLWITVNIYIYIT